MTDRWPASALAQRARTYQTLLPAEAGPSERRGLPNAAADRAEFLLADIALEHLYLRDGWWLPLTELGARKGRGYRHISLAAYLEVKEDLLLFGSLAEAEAARIALRTRDCHTRALHVVPGPPGRCRVGSHAAVPGPPAEDRGDATGEQRVCAHLRPPKSR